MSANTLYFTVTNDLNYDQRMHRICGSLAEAGYRVFLIGRKQKQSTPLIQKNFYQKRLYCLFQKGKLFYVEYNLRLFFYLLFKKMNGICAIDLDTILPVYYISRIKKIPRIYDAHELFCEMKEIVSRPAIYSFWKKIEKMTLPHFPLGYTVNQPIASEYLKLYGHSYAVIRNISRYEPDSQPQVRTDCIIYQGAVNEGRCFEQIIPAMKKVALPLYVFGDGNFLDQAKRLCMEHGVLDKVIFKEKLPPQELKIYTQQARLGINLVEHTGKSYYLSLSNRFFDYIHAGTPQLCMNFPAYRHLNDQYNVAIALDSGSVEEIAAKINGILNDAEAWQTLHGNCVEAAKTLNWQNEEKILLNFYTSVFG